MESLKSVAGIAAPMLQINIDTDQIIPTRILGGLESKGYGVHLFDARRYLADGSPNPGFILNTAPYNQAQVLLAGRNFGCGSSRERAPKALREFGFRALIAPSFGGIFFNNCYRNGIVPVELPAETVQRIADEVCASAGLGIVKVDLETQTVESPGGACFAFEAPAALRQMLLLGQDEIELTLSRIDDIERFRENDRMVRPWAYQSLPTHSH